MPVTELDMVTKAREKQLENAEFPMVVTPLPMFTSSIMFRKELLGLVVFWVDIPIMNDGNDIVPLVTWNVMVYVAGYEDGAYVWLMVY